MSGNNFTMMNRRQFQLASLKSIFICGLESGKSLDVLSRLIRRDDDWAQWGGPNRNFSGPPLNNDQPLPKPVLSWKRPLGQGHAAIVTSGSFGYSVHLDGEQEVVEKWRLDDGQRVWNYRYRVAYHASYSEYDGPHATPTITGDRIIVASIDGQLHAIDISNGQMVWKRDLRADFGTQLPQSGYACSPLIWRDRVILPTLGDPQPAETESYTPNPSLPNGRTATPGAVALDLRTGGNLWKTQTFRSSHSSPIKIEIDNQPMLVFHGMFELVGIDPNNGNVLWKQLLREKAADNVSFTPIWDAKRSQFLISHGYCNFGTQAIKLAKTQDRWRTKIAWTNSRLQVVHTNAVLLGETLLGTKRPSATLMVGIDVRDGHTIFRERGFGKSNLLKIGSQLVVLDEGGDLVGGKLKNDGIAETWRIPVLSKNAWTVPSIAGRRLLLRDSQELKAYRFP